MKNKLFISIFCTAATFASMSYASDPSQRAAQQNLIAAKKQQELNRLNTLSRQELQEHEAYQARIKASRADFSDLSIRNPSALLAQLNQLPEDDKKLTSYDAEHNSLLHFLVLHAPNLQAIQITLHRGSYALFHKNKDGQTPNDIAKYHQRKLQQDRNLLLKQHTHILNLSEMNKAHQDLTNREKQNYQKQRNDALDHEQDMSSYPSFTPTPFTLFQNNVRTQQAQELAEINQKILENKQVCCFLDKAQNCNILYFVGTAAKQYCSIQ